MVTVTNMHTFSVNEGHPRAGLIFGPDGNLYGTTWGTFHHPVVGGTVYRIDPSTNQFTPMYTLPPLDASGHNLDGFNPTAPLTFGHDGLLYGTTQKGGSSGVGVLFRIDPSPANTFKILHNFGSQPGFSDGSTPSGAAVSDGRGNYYGATDQGGTYNAGVIYKWDSHNLSMRTVHVFGSIPPFDPNHPNKLRTNVGGAVPYGSPVFGIDGNLYGMTVYGGDGAGTVYSLDPATQRFCIIDNFVHHDFGDNTDNTPFQTLFLASDGALYGTQTYFAGEQYGTGLVFKVERRVTILHEFGNHSHSVQPRFSNEDGSLPISTPCEGADGMIYGTTSSGGKNGVGTIFRIAKDGTHFESLYSFGDDPSGTGLFPTTGLVSMPDGSMVGTTYLGGAGPGVVYHLSAP
jgi:uncharacterized repeat protein (TIGR03803 family)